MQKGATWMVAEGADEPKHSKSIPVGKGLDDALVAYGQNGEPVRPEQGFPLRLVVPGWQGINNVKWLRRIGLVDEPYMAMMESDDIPSMRLDGKSRWFEFELGPKSSSLALPADTKCPAPDSTKLPAWHGPGREPSSRVEVSTDGGRTYKDATAPRPDSAQSAHAIFLPVELGWQRGGHAVALHG